MTTKLSSASFEMGIRPAAQTAALEDNPGEKFNLILLGDFTGRTNRGQAEALDSRRLSAIDADTFERTLERCAPKLTLAGVLGETTIELTLSSMEDFHPDRLLSRIPALLKLDEARRMLLDPATASQGEAALQALLAASPASPASQPATTRTATTTESDQDTMARLLGGTTPGAKNPASQSSSVEQFIRKVVAPHITATTGASGAVAAAELELAARLNAILHHPDFQSVEAAWRGADLLVRRIESSEEIGIQLLDVSLAELEADLLGNDPSALLRLLRDRKPNLLVGNYTFGRNTNDLHALGKIADFASRLGAPFVATAASQLAGCDSFATHPDPDDWKLKLPADVAEVWERLRRSPQASHLGLAAPRFLLRQPYGKAGDAIESFPFEELPGDPAHEAFLWGHPGILIACVAIDARQIGAIAQGEFSGGEVGDLPVHKFAEDGETVVKSYAEAWLTDRAVDRLLARGILPIVPVKNQNVIRVNHLRSIAPSPATLPIG